MGTLETEAKSKRRKGYVQSAVLAAVGVAGMLLVGMAAPNTLQILGKLGSGKKRFGEEARSALSRLAGKGFIKFEERDGKKFARITEKGRCALALEEQKAAFRLKRRRTWDGRYRMVIFDIPERKRSLRAALRRTMQQAGFLCLQGSVWLYPYDCEDLVMLVKADLHIGKDVLYTIVEKIEGEGWIKRYFGLRS